LQVALQNPYVLVVFSLIFVALAFSMFGFYEIKLPEFLQTKLNKSTSGKQNQGLVGIAIMGFLSALIVGPCVAPASGGATQGPTINADKNPIIAIPTSP
jgi:thiol:disulfide interchange protein DsbD